MGSPNPPYRETGMRVFGLYPWWAFCIYFINMKSFKKLLNWLVGEMLWVIVVFVFLGIGMALTLYINWLFEPAKEILGLIGLLIIGVSFWYGSDLADDIKKQW
ncbi:MAG: hypothetical protein AB198_01750 [Parcubacteria bacterium C7867-003]|nr:MAG: hypothetical protein AB198_01750 [Parcubacteria bacterium C7867-003]